MSIDFARFLSIWLFDLHCPERDFWKLQNPARLTRLLNSYCTARAVKKEPEPKAGGSLYQYMMGGG